MRNVAIVLACSVLLPVAAVSAQSNDVPAFWNALTAAPTMDAVMSVPRPAVTSSAQQQLIEGMLRLRAYEFTSDRTDAFVGTHALELAVERAPRDPWAHFALGAMLARGPDVKERAYAERHAYKVRTFSNAAGRAPRELRKALELDPSMNVAAIELGYLAIDLHDQKMMEEALKILTTGPRADNGPALYVASKIAHRLKLPVEAEGLAKRASAGGVDESVADHERATALFKIDGAETEASEAYFSGLDHLTKEGAAVYFEPIALLATAAETKEWRALPLAERKEWVRKFWDRRAALSGVNLQRRLAEHYRRLDKMTARVGAAIISGAEEDTTKKPATPWGLIFGGNRTIKETEYKNISLIRHGDPTRTEKYMFCAPGWDTLPVPMQPTLFECVKSPFGRSRAGTSGRIALRWAVEKSTPGDTYYPAYTRHLSMAWEAFQFRAPGGGAYVVAAIAVRGQSAAALKNHSNEIQPVITLTLADTAADWIRRAVSEERYSAANLTAQSSMLFGTATAAPAGNAVQLRIALENVDQTAGTIARGVLDVHAFDPDSLSLSDIVISPQDALGSLQRGGVRVALAPGRTFTQAEVPTLYYEVYGVAEGSPVTTEIKVTPIRTGLTNLVRSALGRDDGAISIRFDETATAPHAAYGMQQTRTIGLSSLVPGGYQVTIVVTDKRTGRTTTRQRTLQIDEVAKTEAK